MFHQTLKGVHGTKKIKNLHGLDRLRNRLHKYSISLVQHQMLFFPQIIPDSIYFPVLENCKYCSSTFKIFFTREVVIINGQELRKYEVGVPTGDMMSKQSFMRTHQLVNGSWEQKRFL